MKKTLCLIQGLILLLLLPTFARADVLQISIKGVENKIKENVESGLNINQRHKINTPTEIQLFYQTAPAEIKKALQPFGYFDPTIQSSLTTNKNTWIATFNIELGLPVRIDTLDIQLTGNGAKDSHFLNVVHNSLLEKGRIFSAAEYDELHKGLFAVATDLGYFDAALTKNALVIDLRDNTANIVLHFDTGRRYRFGEIRFSKNPFDNAFLKRFATFSQDEYYNIDKIQKLQDDLLGSNYFREAWVSPQPEQIQNSEVPIDVNLKARPPRQYNLGLGFGTDTGPRGSAGVEFRRLTATGHRFSTNIQASQINSNFQMAYTIPGENPVTDQFFISSSAEDQDETIGQGTLQQLSFGLTKKIRAWQQTLSISIHRERSALNGQSFETQYMLVPKGTWEQLSRDDPIKTSRGTHMLFTLQGAPAALSNTAFAQGLASIKTIQPLGKNRVVGRAAVGYTWINDVKNLPLSFQLAAGGSQSVRGYSYNSIGPGSSLAVGSVEYRQRVRDDWFAAIFFDAGSVSNTFLDNINKGAGAGAVWQSPLGAFALSVAYGIDSGATMLQFSMGQDL